jgi:hypothetical protein
MRLGFELSSVRVTAWVSTAGIGVDEQARNYEFNVLLHDYTDVRFCEGRVRAALVGVG